MAQLPLVVTQVSADVQIGVTLRPAPWVRGSTNYGDCRIVSHVPSPRTPSRRVVHRN